VSCDLTRTRESDAGFTLMELLISITILGILMAAVSAAMMVGLGSNKSTGARIDESRDEQFIAAYFSADAQGAQTIRAGAVAPNCVFAAGGGTVVLTFVGEDLTDVSPPAVEKRTVSYVRRAAPGGRTDELHRLVCKGGATTPGDDGDTTLARNLSAEPTVTCDDGACSPSSRWVNLTLNSGNLKYTLTGYKRTTIP